MKGFMIPKERLEQDVYNCDNLIADAHAKADAAQQDRDWLLRVGVIHIMDKLIEHPEFTGTMSRIKHAMFVTGEESGRSGLKVEVDSSSYDLNTCDSRSSHTTSLNDTLLSFTTTDHASLLVLGNLEKEGMRQLCVLEEANNILDGVLIDGVGGGGGSIGDGGIGVDVGTMASNDVDGASNDNRMVLRIDVGSVVPVSLYCTLYRVLPLRGCEKNLKLL